MNNIAAKTHKNDRPQLPSRSQPRGSSFLCRSNISRFIMLFTGTKTMMHFLPAFAFLWLSFATDLVYSKQLQHQPVKQEVKGGRRHDISDTRSEWLINHALELLRTNDKSHSRRLSIGSNNTPTSAPGEEMHTFSAKKVLLVDAFGQNHVRLNRSYKGLRIMGGDVVVHMDENDQYVGSSQTLREELLELSDVKPRVPAEVAAAAAIASHGGVLVDAATRIGAPKENNPEVVVYARDGNPRLAWDVALSGTARDKKPMTMHVIVDATAGTLVDAFSDTRTLQATGGGKLDASVSRHVAMTQMNLEDITSSKPREGFQHTTNSPSNGTGIGQTEYVGEVMLGTNELGPPWYSLINMQHGSHFTSDALNVAYDLFVGTLFVDFDNVWGDFTPADRQTHAADAHHAQQVSWDYFLNIHDRQGIFDNGDGSYSRVHFGVSYVNAFWSSLCQCMTYGDGDGIIASALVSLDVGAHEMTHGVTSSTADLIYSGESGGLNEATSDIFATMVEYYANNALDTPDYLIGEMVWLQPPFYLRTMINPSDDGFSFDCWFAGIGSFDVHYTSGVANHFFYLLAEGTVNGVPSRTCWLGIDKNGISTGTGTVTGIGREKAERIWYRALTVYMTTDTNYHQAFDATVAAAADLYGYASQEVNIVIEAWRASGVDGDLPTAPPTPTPPKSSNSKSKGKKSGKQGLF